MVKFVEVHRFNDCEMEFIGKEKNTLIENKAERIYRPTYPNDTGILIMCEGDSGISIMSVWLRNGHAICKRERVILIITGNRDDIHLFPSISFSFSIETTTV